MKSLMPCIRPWAPSLGLSVEANARFPSYWIQVVCLPSHAPVEESGYI